MTQATLHIEVTYSPDDGGHYAEVFGDDGRTVYTTKVYGARAMAYNAAENWVGSQV